MPKAIYLTKSRYTAGLQCFRRLWLNVHKPPEFSERVPGSLQAVGNEIGQSAQRLFPGGILVAQAPWEHSAAVARTATLLADRKVPAIFEAALEYGNVRVRVDILERLPNGYWGLREVKSAGSVKDHHFDDVAIQLHVLRNSGIRVSSVELLHVNTNYIFRQRSVSWPKFFSRAEVKLEANKRLRKIELSIKKQLLCLSETKEPNVEPESHCHTPHSCEHWIRCTESKPADWVFNMPNLNSARRSELNELGIHSISDIPDEFPLSPRQKNVRDATRDKKLFIAPDLSSRLRPFGPPAFYLDFEAFTPAIPLYCGTRPYQTIPFQWSLHRVDAKGQLSHDEYLAVGDCDPRREFADTLVKALKNSNSPIIVYSSYEQTRLKELANLFPELKEPLAAVMARLMDLLPIIRSSVYHPKFEFSNSIKTVAPALCPDLTYQDLGEVADGGSASTAFWLVVTGQVDAERSADLRRALLDYCRRDTLALVKVHRALRALGKAP